MAKKFLLLFCIYIVALYYRFGALSHPFWVDEFSSANQAILLEKYDTEVLSQKDRYIEPRNITEHVLIFLSFKVFGVSEKAARMPSVFIGSLVPVLIFLLVRRITPELRSTAINAAFLSMTSYFMITWSQQARGYALQQVLILASVLLYYSIRSQSGGNFLRLKLIALISIFCIGLLTHTTFIFTIFSILLHALITQKKVVTQIFREKGVVFFCFFLFAVTFILLSRTLFFTQIVFFIRSLEVSSAVHGILYYHSLFWREYSWLSIFGLLGLVWLVKKDSMHSILVILPSSYLFFISVLFGPTTSRYTLPIFPFLFVGAAVILDQITLRFYPKKARFAQMMSVVIVILIVASGDKFTVKKKQFYSVNHDFREIALVDYDQVYDIIKKKGDIESGKTAVIDTWPDRLEWYLGADFQPNYTFRWENEGQMKQTPFHINEKGEKIIDFRNQTKLVSTVSDLEKVMKSYPKGFIWIDDQSLPQDIIAYAQQNLKKELYLDHYPLDDNPYSLWPATLYSWGI